MNSEIKKEDYEEPVCPLCIDNLKRGTNITSVPMQRIIDKLDEYFSKNDYSGAEKHLIYWKNEAESGNDQRGKFSIINELMGLYRKTAQKEKALDCVSEVLKLMKILENEDTVSGATAFLNGATVYNAFGMPYESLELFSKAIVIYERELKENDPRLAGLYNNFGLTLVELSRFDEATELYNKALKTLFLSKNAQLELAITHLNIASAYEAKSGLEDAENLIFEQLDLAEELIKDTSVKKDGYYAFVCEKCAPVFSYYGRFFIANELKTEAKKIYERT